MPKIFLSFPKIQPRQIGRVKKKKLAVKIRQKEDEDNLRKYGKSKEYLSELTSNS